MNKNSISRKITTGAIVAAMYIAINYIQELIIPSSSSMLIQIRIAEALMLLATISPEIIGGLTIGCLISNIINVGVIPMDIIIGTLATFISCVLAYKFRNIKFYSIPVLSSFMPVIINSVFIGCELQFFFIKGEFQIGILLAQIGIIAIGEFISSVLLGIPVYKLISKLNIIKN